MRRTVTVSDNKADLFLLFACVFLGMNVISQPLAFVPQILLIVYAVLQKDVKFLPVMMVLLFDKKDFRFLNASAFKISIGIPLSVANIFIITIFLLTLYELFSQKFSKSMNWLFPLSWIALGVSAMITFRAIGRVSFALTPLVAALCFSLYFYGYLLKDSWTDGAHYVITRMTGIGVVFVSLCLPSWAFNRFLFFFVACLPAFGVYLLFSKKTHFVRLLGLSAIFITAMYVVAGRYFARLAADMQIEEGDLGASTFTLLFTFIVSLLSALKMVFMPRLTRKLTMFIPWGALIVCTFMLVYSSMRSQNLGQSSEDVVNFSEVESLSDRFAAKLFIDRGMLWKSAWEEACTPPYIIKRQESRLDIGPRGDLKMRLLPHNMLLFLLVINGWLAGLALALLLWTAHVRSFYPLHYLPSKDPVSFLVITGFTLFIIGGLSGQSMLLIIGDSWGVLLFTGIAFGHYENILKERRFRHAHTLV